MSNYLRIFVTCSGYDSERKISFILQHDSCKSLVVKRSPWTKAIALQWKSVEEGSNFESEILPDDYTTAPTALHTFSAFLNYISNDFLNKMAKILFLP